MKKNCNKSDECMCSSCIMNDEYEGEGKIGGCCGCSLCSDYDNLQNDACPEYGDNE